MVEKEDSEYVGRKAAARAKSTSRRPNGVYGGFGREARNHAKWRGRWADEQFTLACATRTRSACCTRMGRRATTSSGHPPLLSLRRSSPSLRSSGLCPRSSTGYARAVAHNAHHDRHGARGALNDTSEWAGKAERTVAKERWIRVCESLGVHVYRHGSLGSRGEAPRPKSAFDLRRLARKETCTGRCIAQHRRSLVVFLGLSSVAVLGHLTRAEGSHAVVLQIMTESQRGDFKPFLARYWVDLG